MEEEDYNEDYDLIRLARDASARASMTTSMATGLLRYVDSLLSLSEQDILDGNYGEPFDGEDENVLLKILDLQVALRTLYAGGNMIRDRNLSDFIRVVKCIGDLTGVSAIACMNDKLFYSELTRMDERFVRTLITYVGRLMDTGIQ